MRNKRKKGRGMRERKRMQEQSHFLWRVVVDYRWRNFLVVAFVLGPMLLSWNVLVGAQPTPARKPNTVLDEDPFRLPAREREVNPLGDVPEEQPRTPPIREQDLPEQEIPASTSSEETGTPQPSTEEEPPVERTRKPLAPEEEAPVSVEKPRPVEPAVTEPKPEHTGPAPTRELPPGHPPVGPAHAESQTTNAATSADEAKLLSHIHQVTFVGQRAGEGYFSQDGSLLVFQSEREPGNPFYQIYLLDLQSGDIRRVSPGVGKTTCPWIHPNKKKVLFASTHLDPRATEKQKTELAQRASGQERRYAWDFDEQYDLFETDLASGKLNNVSKARGYDAEASWSPDGSLVVFASNRHAYAAQLAVEDQADFNRDPSSQIDIYVMKADGTQVRRLTTSSGYDGGPFFSAAGRKICWRRFSPDGTTAEIFTMNVDGSEQTQITQLGAMSWGPYFHPSGEYLIFASNLEGMKNFELYMVAADGSSTPVRVTFTEGFDGLPVFSPDGKRLAWSSSRGVERRGSTTTTRACRLS
jgi:Tol biopolymer transport system component